MKAHTSTSSYVSPGGTTIAQKLSAFANTFTYENIPAQVKERAKDFILDAVGVALASTDYDFSHRILSGLKGMAGTGQCSLIGMPDRLPMRDAALMNGVLIHGLDYDDSHLGAVLHPSVTSLICALAICEQDDRHGRDLLSAYVLGVENVIRIAAAAKGGFHHFGYHPTGLIAHFSCAIEAAWLYGLSEKQITMAQGLAGSTAAATQEFLEEGAWNKRLHPGWAAVAGITAANLARGGTIGPTKPYEGRLGIYNTHLHDLASQVDYEMITAGLGQTWETLNIAVKPFPVCHFIHACGDSAILLRNTHHINPQDIESITALVAEPTMHIIAEPVENKKRPANDYDAKFSVHYFVAACLLRGEFGLTELKDHSLKSPEILALADKVTAAVDLQSGYPAILSGGVVIKMKDGREFSHHEAVNRGAGNRSLSSKDIEDKFFINAKIAVSDEQARKIRDAVRDLDSLSARDFARILRGNN
jgi:2-methylcitrate dehydratase PrpD